jgi:tight adherence protein B
MSLFVAAIAAAAVFLAMASLIGTFRAVYRRYRERYVTRAISELGEMFLFIDSRQLLVLSASCVVVSGVIAYLAVNPVASGLSAASGLFFPRLLVSWYRKRRLKRFNFQLVDALQAMANALRAGLALTQAIEHVSKESPAPLSQEFGLLIKEVKLGVSMEQALLNLSQRVGSQDLELVVVSTNICRSLGGNMAEMFETIASTIRERFRLEGKIDAITSQGRLQGWIVAAMPLVLGLVLNYMRPDLMRPMLSHPFGYALMGAIALLEALGILWIRRIVDVDI